MRLSLVEALCEPGTSMESGRFPWVENIIARKNISASNGRRSISVRRETDHISSFVLMNVTA
jgi:hypothetical protein